MRAKRSMKKKIKLNLKDWDLGCEVDFQEVIDAAEAAMEKAVGKIEDRLEEKFENMVAAVISNGMNSVLFVTIQSDGRIKIGFGLDECEGMPAEMSWEASLLGCVEGVVLGRLGKNKSIAPEWVDDMVEMRKTFETVVAFINEFLPEDRR